MTQGVRDLTHGSCELGVREGLDSEWCSARGYPQLEQDAGRKAHRKFGAPHALGTDLSQTNDPRQGARLVRAFLRITDPRVRLAIVHMVEKMEFCVRRLLDARHKARFERLRASRQDFLT